MPPTPCPERLRKLIARLNKESNPEARDEARVLRLILSAIQNKRQNDKGPDTYVVNLPSTIKLNLTDYTSDIRNELADALADIDPPSLVERIRECVVCKCLLWAGRADKVACDKHVGLWRKRQNRRDLKQRKTVAATKGRKQKATETFDQMNRTAQAVIRVIMLRSARKSPR